MNQKTYGVMSFLGAVTLALSPPALAQSVPNQEILSDFVRRTVQAQPGGALPAPLDEHQLVNDLYLGLPTLPGLNPPAPWCAGMFYAYRSCEDVSGGLPFSLLVETTPYSSGCDLPPTSLYDLVAATAQGVLPPGAIGAYIVFYKGFDVANQYAFPVSQLGGVGRISPTCSSAANSTGAPANLWSTSPTSVPLNDFQLHVTNAPPGKLGLIFYGAQSPPTPFGDGTLCVGGGSSIFRLSPLGLVDANGSLSRALDFTAPPAVAGPGMIAPGSVWSFQFWYRDPLAGGAGFNLSNGLEVRFCY